MPHLFFRILTISFLTMFLGLTGASAQGRHLVVNKGADYFGHDYKTLKKVSLDKCKQTCLADQSCKAFTYNQKAKWCFLKNGLGELKTFKGAVAGRIVGVDKPATPELAQAKILKFIPPSYWDRAIRFEKRIIKRHGRTAVTDEDAIAAGKLAAAQDDYRKAKGYFEKAAGVNPRSFDNWQALAKSLVLGKGITKAEIRSFKSDAVHASLRAYWLSRTTEGRAQALAYLAQALENNKSYRPALETYKESLALVNSMSLQERFAKLRASKGFRVVDHSIDSDAEAPRVCVQFSENLKADTDYSSFISVDGKPVEGLDVEKRQLCANGLKHGGRYRISVRLGVPSVYSDVLQKNVTLNVTVKDRTAYMRFTGSSFVLPRVGTKGIPVVSVNTEKAKVMIYRIGTRGLNRAIAVNKFLNEMDGYSLEEIENNYGSKIWSGTLEIASIKNKEVITNFPIDKAMPERKPGVYAMIAVPDGDEKDEWENKATQWFVVSDIGLLTQTGSDGLHVFARSLSTAQPLAGIDIQLLSHSNEVLGTGKTDAKGYLKMDAGLVRGTKSMAPGLVLAKNGTVDFVLVDLRKTAIDLSDRGVAGRDWAESMDAYLYTDRGIYRTGETVNINTLLRDAKANAIVDVPLTYKLDRPDGKVEVTKVVKGQGGGAHQLSYTFAENAMHGTWQIRVYADPKGEALVEKRILVEDFEPDRIEFDLTSSDDVVLRSSGARFEIDGRYLYGAPAAGLSIEGKVQFTPTETLAAYKNFVFGLDDEKSKSTVEQLDNLDDLDDQGKTVVKIDPALLPDKASLFKARVTISMSENGGRAVERTLSLPVAPSADMIGIKPLFEGGSVGEGENANFEVIAINPQRKRITMPGVTWSLVKLNRHYQWYYNDDSWEYEPVVSTKKIASGKVDLTAEGLAKISMPIEWGRYRLQITAGEDGPTSSISFSGGWYVEPSSTETPDGLEIALDKKIYSVGDTAKVKISPRFAGKAIVTVGAESLIWKTSVDVPKEGTVVDVPVGGDWGAGAYVNVTLLRAGDEKAERMPSRAIGIKWLKVDPGPRNLAVKLDLPERALPRKPFEVPVHLASLDAGQEAFVTVAVVDVGILNLTRFKTPKPDKWYFGQRKLGLELHDVYGKLIDGYRGAVGLIRSGGDEANELSSNGAPPTQELISFYSGVVKVDENGRALVKFDMPQFNGTVRVTAVAWSKSGVGSTSSEVVVRDPIVVTATVPKFLSPGDKTTLRLDIANLDGAAGDYQLSIDTFGHLKANIPVAGMTVQLDKGETRAVAIDVTGVKIGKGVLAIKLSSTTGPSVEQALAVPVRAPQLPISRRQVVKLAANGGKLTIDRDFLTGMMPGSGVISVGVSRAAGLDVPSLLLSLDRYPYGCAEQTTSRAMPLLYLSEVATQSGLGAEPEIRARIQKAITRVLGYQASEGSFGMWSPGSDNLWLDAYVTDFLTRAREKGYSVPTEAMTSALDNLQNSLSYDVDLASKGNEIAYALYVLSRNKRASIGDLRYFVNSKLGEFVSPLAKAQLAASLGMYGEKLTSEKAFKAAFEGVLSPLDNLQRDDYGTSLRDSAAILALAAESRPAQSFVSKMVSLVSAKRLGKRYTSTQEKAWLLLAARALYSDANSIALDVNGAPFTGNLSRKLTDESIGDGMTIANKSEENLEAAITVSGIPVEPLPAGGEGFTILRTYYNLAGELVDPSVVAQNTRLVVVLEITESNNWSSRIIVNDLLPAGFEIDNPRIVSSADLSSFKWLKRTTPAHTEFHNDRFIAAFNRSASDNRTINLAYVIRVVSPGKYVHPAATVEDMYRPHLSARTGQSHVEVIAPKP